MITLRKDLHQDSQQVEARATVIRLEHFRTKLLARDLYKQIRSTVYLQQKRNLMW